MLKNKNKNKKRIYVVLVVLVMVNVLAWVAVWEVGQSEDLEVVFFDVGQGDSIFIEAKNGFQVLIDGGPGLAVLEKLGAEMPFYDRTIDLIILTHPDRDHLFGLLEVLKRYKVKSILWTGVIKDTSDWREWERLIKDEGANIIIAQADQRIDLADDIYMIIHYPFESLEGQEVEYANDTSVVAELVFNEVSFLFVGDISEKIEKQLNIDSDVLKIAHHGSKYSSSSDFLEKVSPELAVISVGENTYGHPDSGVLQTLEEFGINILTTQDWGDIRIVSDGTFFKLINKQ
ncbi:MBL fold metallo-hydrolase [Patescibacteria group bacterium]|nr:MBL fold metallo-hydrolase [Patescibacteria group bacterium]